MNKVIVLVTSGKHESVDYATVYLFNDINKAVDFCALKNTGYKKYWTKAEIVGDGERVEVYQPEPEE